MLSLALAFLLCFAVSPVALAYATDLNIQSNDSSCEGDNVLLGNEISDDAKERPSGEQGEVDSSLLEDQKVIERDAVLSENDSATKHGQNESSSDSSLLTEELTSTEVLAAAQDTSVFYSAHVSRIGWQPDVQNGDMAGTTGQGLAVEAFRISLQSSLCDLSAADNIVANGYTRSRGWTGKVGAGDTIGTMGLGLPLEAIKLGLGSELGKIYDIYYRSHVSKIGWLGWASNGSLSGAPAQGKQIEAIEIQLVAKGGVAPGDTNGAYLTPAGEFVYSAHVGSIGWQNPVADGQTAGTVGKKKVIEALKFELPSNLDGGVTYQVHAAKLGWMASVSNGTVAGTTGQGRRIEAVKVSLSGQAAIQYDIYYRVHVSKYGWLDWATNGMDAGTTGLGLGVEAIEVVLVGKGSAAPGSVSRPSVNRPVLSYSAHVAKVGWQPFVSNGAVAGTTGLGRSIEALKVTLNSAEISGGIQYKMHVQKLGWQSAVSDGSVAGTEGKALQAEAICISLTGEASQFFDVYYRAHSAKYGWLGWAKNGEKAGTSSCGYRLEALQIEIVGKGASAPGSTAGAYKTTPIAPASHLRMHSLANGLSSRTNWLLLVDTANCIVGVYRGSRGNWTNTAVCPCAPGAVSTPTVKGVFTVQNKGYSFDSGSARCFYWTQFYGNYLFHSTLYYQYSTPSTPMDDRVGMRLSHGCVRMKLKDAKWIYDNIPRNTTVYIY